MIAQTLHIRSQRLNYTICNAEYTLTVHAYYLMRGRIELKFNNRKTKLTIGYFTTHNRKKHEVHIAHFNLMYKLCINLQIYHSISAVPLNAHQSNVPV